MYKVNHSLLVYVPLLSIINFSRNTRSSRWVLPTSCANLPIIQIVALFVFLRKIGKLDDSYRWNNCNRCHCSNRYVYSNRFEKKTMKACGACVVAAITMKGKRLQLLQSLRLQLLQSDYNTHSAIRISLSF